MEGNYERRSISPSPFGGFATPSLRQSGNPFLALHREMNRLFDEAFRGFGMPEGGSGTGALAAVGVAIPRIDVSESDQQLRVRAELPGVDQNDVEITLNDDVLTIRGERRRNRKQAGKLPCDGAVLRQLRPVNSSALHCRSRSGPGDLQGRRADRDAAQASRNAAAGAPHPDQQRRPGTGRHWPKRRN